VHWQWQASVKVFNLSSLDVVIHDLRIGLAHVLATEGAFEISEFNYGDARGAVTLDRLSIQIQGCRDLKMRLSSRGDQQQFFQFV
jgi:hypothetical protein